ncbi:MAG: hypothetical protein V4603_08615 [Pseudomonadota bacterium]
MIRSTALVFSLLTVLGSHPLLITAAESPPNNEAFRQALANREALETAIAKLETNSDLYNSELSEAWLSLGNNLRTLGMHEEATEILGKALQAVRVSSGLHDLQQLPILQQQLQSWLTLENWEEVDATSHLIYYITTKSLPPGAQPRFDALQQLAQWESRATREQLLPAVRQTELLAARLYSKEIQAIKNAAPYEERDTQLATLNLDLAAVELQLTRQIFDTPLMAYENTQQRTNSRLVCTTFRFPNGSVSQTCTNEETPNMAYYFEADNKKDQALNLHFGNMQAAMAETLLLLQADTIGSPAREELMTRMLELSTQYNEFMQERY